MHPRAFLDGFWRNDMAEEVFVAMAFDPAYEPRWDIFKAAIEDEPLHGRTLRAVRVDYRRTGDSILTEIANGIAHAQLILADISTIHRWEEDGKRKSTRNGNVMYEVGLALACRQPVEVILIRDDNDHIVFDVSPIPVLRFDPMDIPGSASLIRHSLIDRLMERDLAKDLRVTQVLESLSQFEINLLRSNAQVDLLAWPGSSLPAAVAMALPRLLDKRVLRLAKLAANDQPDIYAWTTLGRVIARAFESRGEGTR